MFIVSCIQWQSWLADANPPLLLRYCSENVSALCMAEMDALLAWGSGVALGGCAEFGLTAADFLGVCSQLSLTAQPEQQDAPQDKGKGIQQKRLSSSGMPLANVQSQKTKWTKCDLAWPRSRKSDMLDKIPSACRKSCGAVERRNLGASWICDHVTSRRVRLSEPQKEMTDPCLHTAVTIFFFFNIIYRIRNRDRQSFGAKKRWLWVSQLSLLWLQHADCGTMCGLVNDCFMCCFTEAAQLVVWKDIFLLWEYIFNRSWKPQTWPWFQNSCTNFVKEPHTLKQKHIFAFPLLRLFNVLFLSVGFFLFNVLMWKGEISGKNLSTSHLLLHFFRLLGRCCNEIELRDILLSFYVAVFRVYLCSSGQKQKVFKMLALLFRCGQFKNNPCSQPFKFKRHVRLNFKNHLKSTIYLQFKQSTATLEQIMASGFNNVSKSKLKIFVSPQRHRKKKIVSEINL